VSTPYSPTPSGPTRQALQRQRCAPRFVQNEGSCDEVYEAQSHGLGTGCLPFVRWIGPPVRKARFWLRATLYHAGLVTRRPPAKGVRVLTTRPPLPGLPGAKTIQKLSSGSRTIQCSVQLRSTKMAAMRLAEEIMSYPTWVVIL
jgi:hypothetical protein